VPITQREFGELAKESQAPLRNSPFTVHLDAVLLDEEPVAFAGIGINPKKKDRGWAL
jgi:hypothetical protein